MSYTPHEWQNDELITAAKMNNIEEGIAAGGGGGWDAVIRLTHPNNSNADSPANLTPNIVSGSFADLYAKLSNGEFPTILVQYYHPWGMRFAVPMAYIVYISPSIIQMRIYGYSLMSGAIKDFGDGTSLDWASNDEIDWN